ncbi:GNAT family N-acetyltransferase [Salinimicrobium sp. CAU 1759]
MQNETPVACGAFKYFDPETVEVKRMYTKNKSKGKGFAGRVLAQWEAWARTPGYNRCILETGIRC